MGIFRIYPSKSNTIASGYYKRYNSGQNAVTELWYGGGGGDSSLEKRNSISRFIVYFDLEDLQNKFLAKDINENNVVSYKLKMTNTAPRDKVLEREFEFDVLEKQIAASYDLICFPINKDWDEGRGYDMVKDFYVAKQIGNPYLTGYSNWDSATLMNSWDEPGIYNNPTASTAVTYYATQHFDIGNENIEMDITPIVNNWLSGGSSNFGVAVAFRRDYELLSTDTRYVASFFTEKTNTAFKPYLEVKYNQSYVDDRLSVSNNRPCKLFLYTFSGNNSANFFSSSTVTIKNSSNVDVYTGLTPVQVERGVYYVEVWMSGASKGQQFKDIWNGVTFNPGYDQQDITQTFVVQDNYYLSNAPQVNHYSIVTYGLENGGTVWNNESIRVYCDLRVNFSTNVPKTPYDLQYRLIMNNQIECIPWTSINQAVMNKCQSNYFVLETSWLLENQTYEIQFKINELGTSRIAPEKIKFKVARPF
jgi:hypothetical protein